jgi:hypothetical protein
MSDLPEDIKTKLRERREADTGGDPEAWEAVEPWMARSLALVKPGGVVSVVLPDGMPFAARMPLPDGEPAQ